MQILQLFYLACFSATIHSLEYIVDRNKISRRLRKPRVRDVLFWKYQYCAMSRFVPSRDITCHWSFFSYHLQLYTRVRELLNFDEFFLQIFSSIVTSSKFSIEIRSLAHWTVDERKCCFLYDIIFFFFNYFPYAISSMTNAWGHLWQTRCPRNMVINCLSLATTEKHFTQSSTCTTGWSG